MLKYNSFTRPPKNYKNIFKFFSQSIRTSGKDIIFDHKNIEKGIFNKAKKLFNFYKNKNIDDIDINKISF